MLAKHRFSVSPTDWFLAFNAIGCIRASCAPPPNLRTRISLRISCRDLHLICNNLGFGARIGPATCHRAPTTASKPTGRVVNSGLSAGLSTWPPRRARARRPPRHARPRAPRARVDPPEIVRRFTTVPNTLWSYPLRRRRDCIRGGRAWHPARAVHSIVVVGSRVRGRSRDARPGVSSLLPVTCYAHLQPPRRTTAGRRLSPAATPYSL